MNKIVIAILSLLTAGLLFVCVDCSSGRIRYFECSVSGHQYKPAWVETSVNTDSEGNVSIDTIHHQEEYHVFCQELSGARVFDCLTRASIYYVVTNSQIVCVRTREGRWSGAQYLPTIEP